MKNLTSTKIEVDELRFCLSRNFRRIVVSTALQLVNYSGPKIRVFNWSCLDKIKNRGQDSNSRNLSIVGIHVMQFKL